jgi:regulator of replication initiation timing
MEEPFDSLARLLSDVILPNLKSVHTSQQEQMAANERLELEIDELRLHLNSQFAHLTALLTACRAEVAATQAMLRMVGAQGTGLKPDGGTFIH